MQSITTKKIIGTLVSLLFAVSQSLFGQLVTNTNTGLTYSTIQAAIDDPLTLNGHTLTVDPGVYVENILVNKSLTINGPKMGVDGNDPSRGTGEAIVQPSGLSFGGSFGRIVSITATDVIIDGLTFDGDNPALNGCDINGANIDIDLGIFSYGGDGSTPDLSGDNIIIRNNVVKNIYWSAIGLGSGLSTITPKYGQIKYNKIQNVAVGDGIACAQNYYATIEFNTIIDTHWGMEIGFFFLQPLPGKSGSISNNTFTSKILSSPCLSPWTDVRGILIYQLYNNITNAWSITNNTFLNNSTRSIDSRGFDLNINWSPSCLTIANNNITGFESGYSIRNCGNSGNGLTPPTESLTISGGTVNNCSYGVLATNLSEYYGNAQSSNYNLNQVTLANNTIAGIFIDDESLNPINTNPSTVTVNSNNCKINGNPIGIKDSGNYAYATAHENDLSGNSSFVFNNLSTNIADATCNWYGDASGPTNPANPAGTGGTVSTNVGFSPWLNSGTDNDPVTAGFQPLPGSCVTSTIVIICPGNIIKNAGRNCQRSVNTENPDITLLNNTRLIKLTWTMTGATSGNSRNWGINYVGNRNFNVGITTITYTATNNAGFAATCSFTVTVIDVTNPTINCPSDISERAEHNSCSMSIRVDRPEIDDNCNISSLTWEMTGATTGNSPASGINYVGRKTFNVGITTITYTVKDASNNMATCSFTVRVRGSNNCNPTVMNKSVAGTISQDELKIYPNPSNQFFTLDAGLGTNEKIELQIFDTNGKLVEQLSPVSRMPVQFGSNLQKGIYLVKIIRGDKIKTIKVVKQ